MAKLLHLYLAAYDNTRIVTSDIRIHWALLLAPPPREENPDSFEQTTTLYHATNKNGHWALEHRKTECVRTPSMLGRIWLGTVESKRLKSVEELLGDPRRVRADKPGWDCRAWVEEALVDLANERLVQVLHVIELEHLFEYGRRFAEEVLRKGLNFGFGIPVTVQYPGPGQ